MLGVRVWAEQVRVLEMMGAVLAAYALGLGCDLGGQPSNRRLNARSASARGVSFALGFSFFVNIQLIGGQTKALDQQNLYSDLYSVYS